MEATFVAIIWNIALTGKKLFKYLLQGEIITWDSFKDMIIGDNKLY